MLDEILKSLPTGSDTPAFVAHTGQALTRFGIYKIVRRHTSESGDTTFGKHSAISPRCFRHTTAVHLLEAATDIPQVDLFKKIKIVQ